MNFAVCSVLNNGNEHCLCVILFSHLVLFWLWSCLYPALSQHWFLHLLVSVYVLSSEVFSCISLPLRPFVSLFFCRTCSCFVFCFFNPHLVFPWWLSLISLIIWYLHVMFSAYVLTPSMEMRFIFNRISILFYSGFCINTKLTSKLLSVTSSISSSTSTVSNVTRETPLPIIMQSDTPTQSWSGILRFYSVLKKNNNK